MFFAKRSAGAEVERPWLAVRDQTVVCPENGGVMQVTSDTFRPLVVGEDARTELRELGSALGVETLFSRTIGWNVLALARLKHT